MAEAGVEIPEQTARWLWQHVSGMSAHELVIERQRAVSGDEELAFRTLVNRRERREPLQYVLEESEFAGLKLYVDKRVLVPRPETEGLVQLAAAELNGRRQSAPDRRQTVLDLGTGSGAIAVALAVEWQDAQGVHLIASDLSADALAVARLNARRHGVEDLIDWRCGDGLSVLARDERIDLLLANPPYIPLGDAPLLQPEVRDYEPGLALFAGYDGLDAYRRIATSAKDVLAGDATLLFEVGAGQAERVQALFSQALPRAITEAYADFQGILRMVTIKRQV